MLHLIPAWAHRALMPPAHLARKWWLRVFRPRIAGVVVFIRDDEQRVLLIRQSYGSRAWTTPAGGAGLTEDPVAAICREVREELLCELAEITLLAEIDEHMHGAPQRNWIFTARAVGTPEPDLREVLEARWFHLHDLPDALTLPTRRRLALLAGDDG